MDKSEITAIVLAGGAGKRFGLRNKGLIPLEGKALIAHVLARVQPQVDHVLIVANADMASYKALGEDVIEDTAFCGQGPLAGILAGARHAKTPWLLVVPCDMPLLPTDLVNRLKPHLSDHAVAIAHDGERPQFLVALMRTDAALTLQDYLDSSRRSVHGWLATQGFATVDYSDQANSFRNINTPQDLP